MAIEQTIRELGFELPTKTDRRPYDYAKLVGDTVYCSGNGPHANGRPIHVGRLGAELTVDQGREAARQCALNCLAAMKTAIGDLDRVVEIVKVLGFVSCAPDFFDIPNVMNGCTEFLIAVFGERGRHARSAIGTSNLPGNIPVEVELIARVRPK